MQFVGLFYLCEIKSKDFHLQSAEVNDIFWVGKETIDSIDILEPSKSIIAKFLES